MARHSSPSFFFPPLPHRGQGCFPVVLALSVNVCCSTSTSIKLFLFRVVTKSTAHDCRLRGLAINHTDCVRLSVCFVSVCLCTCLCHRFPFFSFFFPDSPLGMKNIYFCPLDPGNANVLAKRSAGKWGIEEPFHSLSSLSTNTGPLHFPFHEKTCLWMLVSSIWMLGMRGIHK